MTLQTVGRVRGKIALVTGAGSGIGRATAVRLAAEGAVVIVGDIDLGAAQACATSISMNGEKATATRLDVVDEDHWIQAISAAVNEYGRLDVLVNNAGISISKPISQLVFDEWRKVFAVNLDGVFIGTKLAIAAMEVNGGGSICRRRFKNVAPGGRKT
jgi:NAD(P)-dependent dehydrogenase (short-subunit alcohol dehydrogenase family)